MSGSQQQTRCGEGCELVHVGGATGNSAEKLHGSYREIEASERLALSLAQQNFLQVD